MTEANEPRRLTGRGVLAILLAAFGVIVGVNLALAWFATGSFPGLVVENSYVASQGFDERRAALEARGWRSEAGWRDGALALSVTDRDGLPVAGLEIIARLGRPASALTDRELQMTGDGGDYRAAVPLAAGRWLAAFTIRDGDSDSFEMHSLILVPGGA